MAEEEAKKRKPRIRKPAATVREKVEKSQVAPQKPRRVRSAAKKATVPFKMAKSALGQEFYLPLPDNRFWRFMNKRRRFTPQYVRDSWAELKLVTWPGRRETWRLTGAVLVFAVVFGVLIAGVDRGLDVLFEKFVLR